MQRSDLLRDQGFSPAVRQRLIEWFARYGASPTYEIEVRIKDVTELGWNTVYKKLSSNRGWSNKPEVVNTTDLMHMTGVRETKQANNAPSTFLRKEKHDHIDVESAGRQVRFAIASEVNTPSENSPVRTVRFKQRTTFEHKRMFKFELTKVKQGDTPAAANAAEVEHEIEIEFCGQSELTPAKHEYAADSLLMKVPAAARHSGSEVAPGGALPLSRGTGWGWFLREPAPCHARARRPRRR